ncbi:carbon-nitrogen hydrolase family protein [Oceanithermus sp.]|uniref:carbon-nitrogen hydrolase family protein n=1 Tax=Oceanithermus sp. TaxID=2268145 RepID=UPI0025D1CFEF|nr:carbon-nitrogen hydrolase family protein [Oceanithermus sp.]
MRLVLVPLRTRRRDPETNARRISAAVRRLATRQQPDLIVFPETALTGYLYRAEDLARFAEPVPGPQTARVGALSRALGVNVAFGLIEATPEGPANTVVLIDRQGCVLLRQRKLSEPPPYVRGRELARADLEGVRLAALTCGDLFSQQALALLPRELDLVLAPMARAFDGRSPDPERWLREERAAYLDAVRNVGVTTAIVNVLEEPAADESEAPSFGGALVVGPGGELLAESPHGTDRPLVFELGVGNVG